MLRIWSVIYIVCACVYTQAQPMKGFEAGAWLGAAHYFGDLNTTYQIDKPRPQGSIALRYNFNQRIALMAKASAMGLAGDDFKSSNAFERDRDLRFFTTLFELGGQIEFNFFPYKHGDKTRYSTPYLFAGASGFRFDPRTRYNGKIERLQPLGTEGQSIGKEYPLIQPALLYGVGYKHDLSPSWSLNIEISARTTFTDYIDDVSSVYPTLAQLSGRSDPSIMYSYNEDKVDRQRGDKKETDGFGMLSIGLMYFFNPLPCPKILKR